MGGQNFPVSFNHILQIFTQDSELSFVFLPQVHKVTEPEQYQPKQPSHLARLPRPPSIWFLGMSSQREIPRQEEKGLTEDELVGWHHQLNGFEFEQTLGDGEGQGSLACCSPWGCKESDTTERLNNNLLNTLGPVPDRLSRPGLSVCSPQAPSSAPTITLKLCCYPHSPLLFDLFLTLYFLRPVSLTAPSVFCQLFLWLVPVKNLVSVVTAIYGSRNQPQIGVNRGV